MKKTIIKRARKLICTGLVMLAVLGISNQECEAQNLDSLEIKLDSIISMGMDSMAYPGAQLIVATKDSILIQKSYGYHTYDRNIKVENHHLYDLASITKVSSGLLLIMKMVEVGLIDLDKPVSEYLKVLCRSNKKKLTLRQILSHQAGLEPYIVFWQNTLKEDGRFRKKTFQEHPSKNYPIKITDSLFLHKKYRNKMVKAIKKSKVEDIKVADYRYSGLVFLLLPELIENVLKTDYEDQLKVNFYNKLNLKKIGYRPIERFQLNDIVPTERDTFFRKTLVHGYVHDEAAAMLDNKSCNAGLFSNAEDLAILFQALMQYGNVGGNSILNKQIVKEFTSYQYPENDNRRGLGFDKPLLDYDADAAYIAKSATASSFGHSGFTGTFVWADPDADILLVFLSNRVYPDRSHRNLYKLNIRPLMHQACYDYLSNH
ncbi:MAG: serine hydrolase [Saprospiraceae bacterium]|nr:serine hydrolase [Saprospiraceae bacterium]